jgi:hypothetical protein
MYSQDKLDNMVPGHMRITNLSRWLQRLHLTVDGISFSWSDTSQSENWCIRCATGTAARTQLDQGPWIQPHDLRSVSVPQKVKR